MQCFEAIEFVGKRIELFKNGLPHIPQNAVLARRNALVRISSVLAIAHTSSAWFLKNVREMQLDPGTKQYFAAKTADPFDASGCFLETEAPQKPS